MAATRQTSQRVTLVMLVLASITVITLDYRGEANHGIGHLRNGIADALAPLQRGVAAVLHPVGDVFAAAFHYGQLQSENQQLRNELGQVQGQDAATAYANAASTAEMFQLSSLPFAPNVSKVAAEVISPSTSNFSEEVEIDQGTSSGVGPGMPVVSGSGLVGSIVRASRSTAWVQLLTSAHTSIAVEDVHTGQYVAAGKGSGTLSIAFATNPPRTGDVLVTSGAGAGTYPPAIPVGRVTTVQNNPGGLSSTASIKPVVDLGSLQYVAVLQWLAPA